MVSSSGPAFPAEYHLGTQRQSLSGSLSLESEFSSRSFSGIRGEIGGQSFLLTHDKPNFTAEQVSLQIGVFHTGPQPPDGKGQRICLSCSAIGLNLDARTFHDNGVVEISLPGADSPARVSHAQTKQFVTGLYRLGFGCDFRVDPNGLSVPVSISLLDSNNQVARLGNTPITWCKDVLCIPANAFDRTFPTG